ncbi:MAG: alkaline phosphatase family protein [Opitutaceae bacterium]|nr:alkaline phosphatase family protein [Opitutaceae bacterium]
MKIPALLSLFCAASLASAQPVKNVLLVTLDGLRWQEMFTGADELLLNKEHGGVADGALPALRRDYWADTPAARREKLMPFLWGTIARQGQLFGNRALNSPVAVSNAERVSYPGYNELLTGRPDPLITNNTPRPNPNVTVLEWLHGRPGFAGRVAASAAWNVFVPIINVGRSRLPVFVTLQQSKPGAVSPRIAEIERWMQDIPPISTSESFDAFAYEAALDLIATHRPRVFLLALGEPDEWAHARRYDRYLDSIRRCDRFIRQLWEILQTQPEYRGTTALVISPDHGRGVLGADWTSHGRKVPRSDETWLVAMGPGIAARGERRDTALLHQAQVAATVAALLGEDFRAAFPEAAPPVMEWLGVEKR